MLSLLGRLPDARADGGRVAELRRSAEGISRQLGGWIESLKNSSLKGTRHVNDQARQAAHSARRREAFLDGLSRIQVEGPRPPAPPNEGESPLS